MRIFARVVLASVGLFLVGCDGGDPDVAGMGGLGGLAAAGLGGAGGEVAELPECELGGQDLQEPTPCPEGPRRDSRGNLCALNCYTSGGLILVNCHAQYAVAPATQGLLVHCLAGISCNACD